MEKTNLYPPQALGVTDYMLQVQVIRIQEKGNYFLTVTSKIHNQIPGTLFKSGDYSQDYNVMFRFMIGRRTVWIFLLVFI